MTLRPAELLLVAAELARTLPGRPLQKVVSAGLDRYAFGFPGAWLLVVTDRRFGRLHLIDRKPPGTGEAAPARVMLLRKELVGLRLTAVEAVAGERALGLDFERGELRRRLLVFLFGNGPRLVLLDGERRVLGAFPPPAPGGDPVPVELPPPREDDRPARFGAEGTSAAISLRYATLEQGSGVDTARTAAAAVARRALDKVRRREEALLRDLARLDDAQARRRHADLLLAHLAQVPRGAAEVTLPDDFEEGSPPVTIRLDPARSASDNVARMYHEYRRLSRARPLVEGRLAAARAEREAAEERLAAIEAGDLAALAGLPAPGRAQGGDGRASPGGPAHAARPPRSVPYRAFRSATGTPILVGKGAEKNDELTFRVAAGNDLWLHTRDVPGAHVVVPLANRAVDEATLLDAATLALWFSPVRPAEPLSDETAGKVQADVTYAQRKLVRKPRGAPPGRVSVAGGKTIRIRLEPERLRRLLASRTDSPNNG